MRARKRPCDEPLGPRNLCGLVSKIHHREGGVRGGCRSPASGPPSDGLRVQCHPPPQHFVCCDSRCEDHRCRDEGNDCWTESSADHRSCEGDEWHVVNNPHDRHRFSCCMRSPEPGDVFDEG